MGLVQIKPVPPWHQSTEFLTSCAKLYVEAAIKNNPQPGGMDSARGLQVHRTVAAYCAYCALQGIASDLKAFDEFAAGAGPVAARILSGLRDSFEVDYEHLLATELTLSLDAQFQPTDLAEVIAGGATDSGQAPMVVGTLDALYTFPLESTMRIDDTKTHPKPFDPSETLQGKTYALLVFLHFPWVQKIIFRLIFVRYRNVTRSAEFTRDMLPALMATVSAARDRQIKIHADYAAGKEIDAVAGNHCLGGETRFITRGGIRSLKEACGECVQVLDRHGRWMPAVIRSFGTQQLMRITFDDGSVIRATPEHRWWKLERHPQNGGWRQTDERITTMDLDRVPLAKHEDMPELEVQAIRHGFVYGDGYKRPDRESCIAKMVGPKDHMAQFFPGARRRKDGHLYKEGLPGHFKTLRGINSPGYARGFIAGALAADGSVCGNGGVHLYCEGRKKAEALAEVARLGGCVVSSVRLADSKPTNYSPAGSTCRELMQINIKPSTAPILDPRRTERIHKKHQLRRMFREVVSIALDAVEEVFCAVVPGTESFTLANGIITSNCLYCPLLSNAKCPIAAYNPAMQLTMEQRLNFNLWYGQFSKANNAALRAYAQETGRNVVLRDFNGKAYVYGPVDKEQEVYPVFRFTSEGMEVVAQHRPVLPIIDLLYDYAHDNPDDTGWMKNVTLSATSLKKYLKTNKRSFLDQAIEDTTEKVTKVALRVSKPLDAVPQEDDWDEDDEEEF